MTLDQAVQHAKERCVIGPTVRPELGPCHDYVGPRQYRSRICVNGKSERVSRIVLTHALGRPIIDGLYACHHCDRLSCVRVEHLYEGSPSRNILDQYARGRISPLATPQIKAKALAARKASSSYSGTGHPNAKLNPNSVRAIRRLHAIGISVRQLCRAYGVTPPALYGVVRRTTWVDVEDYLIEVASPFLEP